MWSNFFFQVKKKEAKKSLVTTTAAVSQARNALVSAWYAVLKPRPPGEVAAIADGEGLFPVICWRTQFAPTVVLASTRRGKLRSPVNNN